VSLTNDMLNNLAKRHSLSRNNQLLLNDATTNASNKSYYASYVIFILFLILLLATPVIIFYIENDYIESHHAIATPVVAPHPVAIQKNAVPTALVKTAVPESSQDQATELYQQALTLISQNEISAATEKLSRILEIQPSYTDARGALATLYLENNETDAAISVLRKGLVKDPNNLPLTLLYARAMIMQNRNQDALLALDNVANAAGNDTTYLELLANVQESLGHYADAVSLYKSLLQNNPANDRWLVSLGVALENTGDKLAALDAYKRANNSGELPPDLQNYVTGRIQNLGS